MAKNLSLDDIKKAKEAIEVLGGLIQDSVSSSSSSLPHGSRDSSCSLPGPSVSPPGLSASLPGPSNLREEKESKSNSGRHTYVYYGSCVDICYIM